MIAVRAPPVDRFMNTIYALPCRILVGSVGQARLQIEGVDHLSGFLVLVSVFAIELLQILLDVRRSAMVLTLFRGIDRH